MNWGRVGTARRRGRAMLSIAGFAIFIAVPLLIASRAFNDPWSGFRVPDLLVQLLVPLLLLVHPIAAPFSSLSGPVGPNVVGIPTSLLVPAIGIGGVVFGLAWMWRIYKAPTRYEGAHWRFRDH